MIHPEKSKRDNPVLSFLSKGRIMAVIFSGGRRAVKGGGAADLQDTIFYSRILRHVQKNFS